MLHDRARFLRKPATGKKPGSGAKEPDCISVRDYVHLHAVLSLSPLLRNAFSLASATVLLTRSITSPVSAREAPVFLSFAVLSLLSEGPQLGVCFLSASISSPRASLRSALLSAPGSTSASISPPSNDLSKSFESACSQPKSRNLSFHYHHYRFKIISSCSTVHSLLCCRPHHV